MTFVNVFVVKSKIVLCEQAGCLSAVQTRCILLIKVENERVALRYTDHTKCTINATVYIERQAALKRIK